MSFKKPIFYGYDLEKRTGTGLLTIIHVDDKNTEVLEVRLTQCGVQVDLTDKSITARFVSATDKLLFSDNIVCNINGQGNILIPFDNAVIKSRKCDLNIEVNIIDGADILTLPFPLCVRVNGSILDNAEISPESEGTIPELLQEATAELERVKPFENGKSAYEMAVENGFEGTLEEWLETLRGVGVTEVYISGRNLYATYSQPGGEEMTEMIGTVVGANGRDGVNGDSFSTAEIDANGDLIVYKTTGAGATMQKNIGHVVGAAGADWVPTAAEKTAIATEAAGMVHVPTKTSDLTNDSGFLTSHQDITGKEDKSNKVTEIPASPVSGTYPTAGAVKSFVEGKGYLTQHQSLSNYYTKAETDTALSGKAATDHTHSQYLTEHQDISGKADKLPVGTSGEIVNANGNGEIQRSGYRISTNKDFIADRDSANSVIPNARAVAQYVEGKGYLTQHQDISGKADKSDIPTKTSDLQNDSGFLTEHQSLLNYYNKTDVNNLLNGKANASHTHAQYLTQHQDISGKADKSDTYTKAEVDAAIQSAPGIIVFAQENAAVTAYLQNANYSASDYSGSVVETYNTNTYGTNRDRPVGKSLTIPSGAASVRLLDTLSGDAYTAAVSGQSYFLKSLIPDRMYLYTFLSANGAVVGSGSVIFNGKVRMIDAGGSTFNIRDIGGWKCDGGTLAYGKIIRGCELNDNNYNVSLTSEQQRFFREFLNIRDEIDLRNASQTDGADNQQGTSDDIVDTALGDGVTYVRYPVVEYATGLDLSNTVYTANYANCIKRIADDLKKGLPIYLHCMAGADRTGTVCALIEAICGVSQTDIDKEFELTTFSGNTRRRNGTSWSGMVTLINSFTGDTFRDKVLYYMLHAGVTIDEINAIRKGLINGYAHELSEPEQPAGRIPAEYQEVEYIASSGTQTIQIPFDSTYVGGYIEMDIKRTNSGVRGLIGSASTNTVDIGAAGGTYFGWTTTGLYEMGPSQTSSITSSTSSFDHVKFEWTAAGSGKLTVNGTVATSRSGSTAYSRWNVFGGTAYPVSCQMKDVVVYNIAGGGTKTAHLVPCYRKADNVIGLYDIVTDTFYTNIGSGAFTKGADVTE